MAQETIDARVSALEKTVEELATRQDAQTVRDELHTVRDDLRAEIRAGDQKTRDDLHGSLERRTAEILAIITASEEETRRYMRVLHENVIERIDRLRG